MTWVRFDDQFPIHRKIGGLSDALYRLHTESIFWCARNMTDGVIFRAEFKQVSRKAKPKNAELLVSFGLWHEAGKLCTSCAESLAEAGTPEPTDGWVIHDYLQFQPSRSKVVQDRQAKAERQAKWLATKRGGRRPADASRDASQVASTDVSKDAAPFARDANPAPPRPEGSGAKPRGASRPLASLGGGRRAGEENPDWRTLPAIGAERDPQDIARNQRGAAAARAALARSPEVEAS